jgi:predicted RNase H-like HicB family nuclease|tara:strand:- start:277 stop:519 length:243 start_codon:yes stop_codon:yes gene_type:complete
MEEKILDFNVLIEQDEDGVYVATVPEIQGCHTQGRDIPEVLERIKEAIELCLEADQEEVEPMKFIGVQKIQIRRPTITSN